VTAQSRRNGALETEHQFGTEMAAPVFKEGPQLAPESSSSTKSANGSRAIRRGKTKTFP